MTAGKALIPIPARTGSEADPSMRDDAGAEPLASSQP